MSVIIMLPIALHLENIGSNPIYILLLPISVTYIIELTNADKIIYFLWFISL